MLSVLTNVYRFLIEEEDQAMDVKAEKDVAMRRFNRRRKIKWLFQAAAVLFVLAQSSVYWIPIAADLLRQTAAVFRSHLFVFALFNSIILAVYALSAGIPRPSNDAAPEQSDLCDEFVTNSRRASAAEESPPPPETAVSEIVGAEPKGETENEKALAVVVVSAKSQIRSGNHQRIRSASFGTRTATTVVGGGGESRREFRRSYTDILRKLTPRGGESEATAARKSSAVNRMSNEEFNRWIEDFIAKHKWTQQEEYREERKTERFNVALTTTATTVCQ